MLLSLSRIRKGRVNIILAQFSRGLKNRSTMHPKSEEEIGDEIVCGFDECGKGAVLGPQIVVSLTMKVMHIYMSNSHDIHVQKMI